MQVIAIRTYVIVETVAVSEATIAVDSSVYVTVLLSFCLLKSSIIEVILLFASTLLA